MLERTLRCVLILLAGLASIAFGEPAPPVLAAQSPRAGLGREFHGGRRALLRERAGEGVYVFRGLPQTRGYHTFRQDKTFWYLTGVESPGAALVMHAPSGREILFLPAPNPGKEAWEGEIWDSGDGWVRELTGVGEVRASSELLDVLGELLEEGALVWTTLSPYVALGDAIDRARPFDSAQARDPLDGRPSREVALKQALEKRFSVEVRDCARFLAEMRQVKTPEEIAAMRRAAQVGARAMTEAISATRADMGEWELEALMSGIFLREGAAGPAYYAIVGSGPNSCILHYSTSSKRMRAGEVVLIDFGPELDHYTTDITRTWPVDATFSARQRELYEAVLAAQEAGIAAVRPGSTIQAVEKACRDVLVERGFGGLIRHSSCHLIGMEVHDVGDGRKPLVPGVAFTIEPGLYEQETSIGIRIEDTVVVTEDGCEVLSRGVPKAREAIEALRAEGLASAVQQPR